MPLVFVHGINVRNDRGYYRELVQRNHCFENIFFKLLECSPGEDRILNPYWGDLAPQATAGNPFLPAAVAAAREKAPCLTLKALAEKSHLLGEKNAIVKLLREHSVPHVMDVLAAVSVDDESSDEEFAAQSNSMSQLGFRLLQLSKRMKTAELQKKWLYGITSDEQFFKKLQADLKIDHKEVALTRLRNTSKWFHNRVQSARQSVHKPIVASGRLAAQKAKEVRGTVRRTTTNLAAKALSNPLRNAFHRHLSIFIGDSFCYFSHRGLQDRPGTIPLRVKEAIEKAAQMKDPVNDPQLIVVAHSMGGIIMCDLISYFDLDAEIDVLITVGSQFPLFADLKMFHGLDYSQERIPRPSKVKRWINIYDPNDFLGFAAGQLFDGVEDVEFATGRLGVSTHADYFKFFSFYECAAEALLKQPAQIGQS